MLCVFWKDLYQDAGVGSLGTDDSFLLFFFLMFWEPIVLV